MNNLKFEKIVLLDISILILTYFLVGCCWPWNVRCEIEQKVEIDNYLNCTYKVNTYLWINDWTGLSINTEKAIYANNICKACIDSVKKAQYDIIYPYYLKVKKCIDSGIDPCKEKQ